jgi:inner membrane protein
MLLRTHLAINFFFAMLFVNSVQHKTIFIALVLLATMLPDIDNLNSYIGKRARALSRTVRFFSKHREFFHSLACSLLLGMLLLVIAPNIAFPFFIGYSMHILADSFTVEGVQILWPLEKRSKGPIKTNGLTEKIIFAILIIADIVYFSYIF